MDHIADPQDLVAHVLDRWPDAARVFTGRRMGCVGCVMARYVTLSEAAHVYGLDLDDFLAELTRVAERGRTSACAPRHAD